MKVKTTFKNIKEQKRLMLGVGYCNLQRLLSVCKFDPTLYNSTINGWACDYYPINEQLGVVTGYNFSRACTIATYDLNDDFQQKLHALENKAYSVEWRSKESEDLKNEFIALLEEVLNGNYRK